MLCPFCNANDDRVIDSRSSEGGRAIRRRRVCNRCDKRFTTYERVETLVRLMVIKRDGLRQTFEPQKIMASIEAACGKRPISAEQKQQVVDEVEELLYAEFDREVPSARIGQLVMDRLRHIDQVAYVRYASEYKNFDQVDDLLQEIEELKARSRAEMPGQGELFDATASSPRGASTTQVAGPA